LKGEIVGLALNEKRGVAKLPVKILKLLKDRGVEGDGHIDTFKQVALLSVEERDKISPVKLKTGDCAENILIKGVDNLSSLKVGDIIKINGEEVLQVVQIGKNYSPEELASSPIHKKTIKPVLPVAGVFCKVLKTMEIKIGDEITFILKLKKG